MLYWKIYCFQKKSKKSEQERIEDEKESKKIQIKKHKKEKLKKKQKKSIRIIVNLIYQFLCIRHTSIDLHELSNRWYLDDKIESRQ